MLQIASGAILTATLVGIGVLIAQFTKKMSEVRACQHLCTSELIPCLPSTATCAQFDAEFIIQT